MTLLSTSTVDFVGVASAAYTGKEAQGKAAKMNRKTKIWIILMRPAFFGLPAWYFLSLIFISPFVQFSIAVLKAITVPAKVIADIRELFLAP